MCTNLVILAPGETNYRFLNGSEIVHSRLIIATALSLITFIHISVGASQHNWKIITSMLRHLLLLYRLANQSRNLSAFSCLLVCDQSDRVDRILLVTSFLWHSHLLHASRMTASSRHAGETLAQFCYSFRTLCKPTKAVVILIYQPFLSSYPSKTKITRRRTSRSRESIAILMQNCGS